MALAGKYMEFSELLSPQLRAAAGADYENITTNQKQRLENALHVLGSAPPESEQALRGMFELNQVENEIINFLS